MNFEEWQNENLNELMSDFIDAHEDMFDEFCKGNFDCQKDVSSTKGEGK